MHSKKYNEVTSPRTLAKGRQNNQVPVHLLHPLCDTATKIPFMYSFSGNQTGLNPFHIHVSMSDIYIPRIGQ